jgi:uncharacterized protein
MSKPSAAVRPLSKQDLLDLLDGSALLGAGGGGPRSVGAEIIDALAKQGLTAQLADPAAIADDATMAISAFAGAPSAATGAFDWSPATRAFEALDRQLHPDRPFGYALPAEVGAGNTFIPLAVAASLATPVPVVDAAGARRAIPDLAEVTYAADGIPVAPIVVSSGEQTLALEVGDPIVAGNVLHGVIDGLGDAAGIALWAMTGAQMKRSAVRGTTTYAIDLGRTIREARTAGRPPWEAAARFMGGRVLFHGTVTSVDEEVSNSFDVGQVVVRDADGCELRVYDENENLMAWSSRRARPLCLAPDLICYMTAGGVPFSNADPEMAPGTAVYVLVAPSIPELRVPYIVGQFETTLRKMGYGGPYVPVEELE